MSCKHDCEQPAIFPVTIHNRPGLDRIAYRIGDYARYRRVMLSALNQSSVLRAWTHRGADDPGIALLEGAAEVAEVLTFYQDLYANEAYLRTADWRESVTDLVALTGYRPAAGVGGEALFAVAVRGEESVTVPAGFGFKAQLADAEKPAEFESAQAVDAHPAMNRFHLYRTRTAPTKVRDNLTRLELAAVDGARDLAGREAVSLDPGDRVMLLPDTGQWNSGGGSFDAGAAIGPEIAIVKEVRAHLDRVVVEFEGGLSNDYDAISVQAYKIERSFRHFGHMAPNKVGAVDEEGVFTTDDTVFHRKIRADYSSADETVYSSLEARAMPLAGEVDDLAVKRPLICEGYTDIEGDDDDEPVRFTVVRTINSVSADTLTWGGMSGAVTVVRLDEQLIANSALDFDQADLRRLRFHETAGPELTFRAPTDWDSGAFTDNKVNFFGTYRQALALAGRNLLLVHEDGRTRQLTVASKREDIDPTGRDESHRWMWPVVLGSGPGFDREAFDEETPRVTVYGNLVPATQGKSEDETVLGSGDGRRRFQTFKLPKGPLTHFLNAGATPAEVPELEVFVDGIRWRRVPVLFAQGGKERVYVVRHDDEGNSYIQFGDGRTGARLPSGRDNVRAVWRTGIGARGELAEGATPSATGKLKPLDDVFLPRPVTGGGEPESTDAARRNAPPRMQSLGRMVALADYEVEAAALPGVEKVRARYVAPSGSPQVRISILTAGGEAAEIENVRKTLTAYNRCRGTARYPVVIVRGLRRYIHAALTIGYDPARRREDMEVVVVSALGTMGVDEGDGGAGLMALDQRGFGDPLHRSQVVAAVQQVAGVSWVRLEALQPIPEGSPPETDPAALPVPASAAVQSVVSCPGDRVLALYRNHLELAFTGDVDARECES